MDQIEYGNKLIKLGQMMKSDKTKLKDLIAMALECGLIYSFRLEPDPKDSIEMEIERGK